MLSDSRIHFHLKLNTAIALTSWFMKRDNEFRVLFLLHNWLQWPSIPRTSSFIFMALN